MKDCRHPLYREVRISEGLATLTALMLAMNNLACFKTIEWGPSQFLKIDPILPQRMHQSLSDLPTSIL